MLNKIKKPVKEGRTTSILANIFCLENCVCFLCMLHIIQVHFRKDFIMEAKTMNPDQAVPKELSDLGSFKK